MKIKKYLTMVLTVLVLFAVLTGCTAQQAVSTASSQETAAGLAADARIEIKGEGVSIILTSADMKAREQKTITCTNIDSNGDIMEVTVSGFSLRDVLEENGITLSELASLNLAASDGYIMSVPADNYAESDVYILLYFEGEALLYPRSGIPDKRAMYWVKDLTKIDLVSKDTEAQTEESIVSRIDFFREGVKAMDAEVLNNRGFEVPAYSLKAYYEKYMDVLPAAPLTMIAKDGFQKTETAEVFFDNYVTLEAEEGEEGDLPLYFSETISEGMRVKFLDFVISGSSAIYFGSEISVADLFKAVGMGKADSYSFIASDGFETQIPAGAIEFGTIFEDDEEGFVRASFDGYDWGDTKGGGKVKYLISIKAVGEVSAPDAADPAKETEMKPAQEASEETLLKCFIGDKKMMISEADFFSLPQIEKDLTITNSKGETVTGVYRGVHWSEIAKFIGADASSDAVLMASDDYEAVITSDILSDPDSLFALYKDGEPIESEGDGRVWFCASEKFTANNWTKFITKIVIE